MADTVNEPQEFAKSRNYASGECAKVVETNPEAKKSSHIINEMIDEYMLNPCKTKIWFVIELCETIQAQRIVLANYELFSSMPKDFSVFFSDTFPALDWKLVGKFTATDIRKSQSFDLNQVGFGKYIRVEMHSHYGNEHYCPISEVKVFGASMVDEYAFDNVEPKPKLIEEPLPQNKTTNTPRFGRKTSAFQIYHGMITDPNVCGLAKSLISGEDSATSQIGHSDKEQPVKIVPPPPTQQPTTPLKPSIFVELSNKVKALESSSKSKMEEIERKVLEVESEFEKFALDFKTSNTNMNTLTLIVIAYLVYKLMLDLM